MLWNISLGVAGGFNSIAAVFTISHEPSCNIQEKNMLLFQIHELNTSHLLPSLFSPDFPLRKTSLLFNLPVPPSCMRRQKCKQLNLLFLPLLEPSVLRGTFFSQQVLLAWPEERTLFPCMPLASAGRALQVVFLKNSILFPRSFLDNVYSRIIWVHGSLAAGRPIYKLPGEVEENVIHEHKAPPRWTKGCIPSSWYKAELTPVISER